MSQLIDQIKSQFKSGSMNLKLIMINVGVFILALVASIILKLTIPKFDLSLYLSAPSDFEQLLYRPWTLITYMFSHDLKGIGHLFFNMLMLYFMGNFFEQKLGSRKLLSTYLIGGLLGYLLFALAYNFLPAISNGQTNQILIGASGAVTAIFVSIGIYMPNYKIQLPLIRQSFKLIHFVAFFIILDLIRLQTSIGTIDGNTGGWLAHIGGAVFGIIYATQLKKGVNISKQFEKMIDWIFNLFKKKPKLKVKYPKRKETSKPPRDDYKYNENKVDNQKKTDIILDKISKSGYESLSKKEKDFLFRQSKS